MEKLALCIVLTLFAYCAARYDPCPPAALIKPCTCLSSQVFHSVDCENITSMEQLNTIFERSGDRSFTNFALYNSTLLYLPATSLSQKKFEILMVGNVSMGSFFDQQPGESNRISTIMMVNCRFQIRVGWDLYRNLIHLKSFYAEDTEITKLGNNFADNVSSGLQRFSLIRAKTKKVHDTAFSRMRELYFLEISNSEIIVLKRSMFSRPAKLEYINFANNKIKELPEDLFSNMPYLKDVILTDNKITTMSETSIGERFNSLTELDLEGNPLICDCGISWMVSRPGLYRTKGICVLPQDKTGKTLQRLKEIDFGYCSK